MKDLLIITKTLEGQKLTKGYRKKPVQSIIKDYTKMRLVKVNVDNNGNPYLVPTYKYVTK